jgi:hypothetical protein
MISGVNVTVYTTDAKADRAVFRGVLGIPLAEAGEGWLIFALPPAELAFHSASEDGKYVIYLNCDEMATTIQALKKRKSNVAPL